MNKTRLILPVVVAIAILLFLGLAVSSTTGLFMQSTAKETLKVRMGGTPIANGLPVYMAIDKGYFKEAGIDMEYTKFEAPNQLIDALLQNKLDFTFTGSPLGIAAVADYKNPGKMKLYMINEGTIEQPTSALLVPKDSNISSVSDLNGKKLGIFGGSLQWKLLATYLLEKNGLQADKDVTLVELATAAQVSTLAAKQVDALLALEPVTTIAQSTNAGKMLQNGAMEKTLSNPLVIGAGIVNTDFAKNHPAETKMIIEIINKAAKEMEQNPSEARKYLKNYTPLTDEVAGKITMPMFEACEEISQNELDTMQKFLDIFTTYGAVDGKINANDLLYCKGNAS